MSNLGAKLSRWARKLHVPLNSKDAATDPRIPELLREGRWIGMIYFDLVDFELTEQIYGTLYCRQVLTALDELINERVEELLAPHRVLEISRRGDDLVVYFHATNSPPPSGPELSRTAEQLRERLGTELSARCKHLIPTGLNFHVGFSLIEPDDDTRGNAERALYKAYKEAVLVAKNQVDALEMERRRDFTDLLLNEAIHMVYQPILRMDSGRIIGYEALCRGPENSFFTSPLNLFGYAEKTNHLYALERIARKKALAGLNELSGSMLFLNINPKVVHDPTFRADEIRDHLHELGATPDRVVFEITERTGIEDFRSFRKSLEYYRQHGFKVAVDDAGAGYSSLQAVAELQPDFIKIDQSLIRDIDQNATKRILVETFLTFGEKTGGRIIAEGIETAAELATLQGLGVPFGQGFFLALPAYPPPPVDAAAARLMKENDTQSVRDRNSRLGRIVPVGGISQGVTTMNIHTVTKDVVDFFTGHPQVEGVAVLGDDHRPAGLIMRDKLFNQLGTQFGFAVYTERPIYLVMDPQALIVENDTPVEVVSQLAMARPDHKVYDSIIVTKNGIYHGLVSVRQLLDAITGIQVEAARFANPLTGLPGNRLIEEELLSRLGGGQPFSVIYTDLDHFKGFNDRYGFERGDQAIKMTASILTEQVSRLGRPDDLVGHIGGDDFIVVTRPEVSEAICRGVIEAFDERVPELYDPEDRKRGYIDSRDRQDRPVRLPLMTVSLALIDCHPGHYQSPEELSRIAAGLKKYAKSMEGSVFVKERRHRPS
ncbi:GGDEF domain-containing protein [Kyrpidia sp.]|uniref:GGDEF domain-containing protein n=1 Tax=Kyrpidia sp. TaxID=2073077 RepID=UPI0025828FAC|nr:GGDEF domain-containing protein [Kyrpidia sp.]MCL6576358.1 GGDEF domain-containing protein [Kyrpidia sp.]